MVDLNLLGELLVSSTFYMFNYYMKLNCKRQHITHPIYNYNSHLYCHAQRNAMRKVISGRKELVDTKSIKFVYFH